MISIIGAGPSGSYLAFLLAKAGYDVRIFEDHKCVGTPIQCTGILTESFLEIAKPKKEFLVNTISRISVNSRNASVILEMKRKDFIVNRALFDSYFCNRAVDEGAKLFLNHRFLGFNGKDMRIKDNEDNKIKNLETDILVGADGPLSSVAKSVGIYGKRKILIGMQAVLKTKTERDKFDTFFGSQIPKFFGWFVPESEDIARVGLATEVNTKIYFDAFMRRFEGKVLEVQAGPIPVYEPSIGIQKDNVYLVGDSACQIKNTTGGGIVFGMLSAKVLADSIISQKDYKTQIMRKLWKDLTMHYWMRKFLDKFTDKDYDDLINLVKKDTVKDVLEEYDREFPSKFLFKLLMREPRFLKFASKFLLGL